MGLRQGVVVQRHQAGALLRSPQDMLHSASATEYFPLTLTLSLPPSRRAKAPLRRDGGREREQRASDGCLAKNCLPNSGTVVIERWWTILPLPKGEGRGEGEQSVANPTVQFVMISLKFRLDVRSIKTKFKSKRIEGKSKERARLRLRLRVGVSARVAGRLKGRAGGRCRGRFRVFHSWGPGRRC